MAAIRLSMAGITLAVAFAAGCATAALPYFPDHDPYETGGPLGLGDAALIGVEYIQAKPGDTVTLESAQAIGIDPAIVTAYVMPAEQAPGFWPASQPLEGVMLLEIAAPLEGYAFSDGDGYVGIVLAIRPAVAGEYAYTQIELRYRVNDAEPQTQVFPAAGRVCVADPAPAECSASGAES